MRGRLSLAAGLAAACGVAAVAQACTDGTTPDCSDAQCLPVIEVEGGGEAGAPADASAGDTGHAAADGSLSDASNERDAPDGG